MPPFSGYKRVQHIPPKVGNLLPEYITPHPKIQYSCLGTRFNDVCVCMSFAVYGPKKLRSHVNKEIISWKTMEKSSALEDVMQ
jgi:hypothetical protein